MYFFIVIATTIVLPIGSALVDAFSMFGELPPLNAAIALLGKWYVLWAGGIRLLLAGLRQTFQPAFTLKQIFEIDHKPSEHIVQELGFANISMGVVSLFTVMDLALLPAGALVGGLYYGLAGLKHLTGGERNTNRTLAMVTDMLVFAVLATYFAMFVMGQFGV
jgi:hypothetical protein